MLLRTLLAVASDPLRARLEDLLDSRDLNMLEPATSEDVWRYLQTEDLDFVVCEETAEAPIADGLLRTMRSLPDPPAVVVVTDEEDPSRRASLLASGASAVLNTGISDRELRATLRALVDRLRREAETRLDVERHRREGSLDGLVARSAAMAGVVDMVKRVAGAETSILLLGETGVGKERVARAIHHESGQSSGPFVALNCGAIPETLLEAELFGWEHGAFTGATRARRGHFEAAHGGTIFLDEIGELPLHLQVKLLRVVEERRLQRLGSERSQEVDVRILAATNRDLGADVAAGRFRPDLYFRLAVVTIAIPPLRDRRDDVPDLVAGLLGRIRASTGKTIAGVETDAMEALTGYAWPGNVRELLNVLERAALLTASDRITIADLPATIVRATSPADGPGFESDHDLDAAALPIREARQQAVRAFESAYLSRLLRQTGGRIGETARLAGISERALYALMRANGLDKADFRGAKTE